MKSLNRVWKDLRAGENVDLYITLIAALALAILNLVGVAPGSLITPLILAVLAMVTITILGNRFRLENIARQISPISDSRIVEEFPTEFLSDIERSQELWVIGVHLGLTLEKYYSLFEEKLKRGHLLRFIVLDPKGEACKMVAMRFEGKINESQEQVRIHSTLENLCELKKTAPNKLEIRTIDYLIGQSVFLVDPHSSHGIAYIARHTFRSGRTKPKFIFRCGFGNWYELILEESKALWENAIPFECDVDKRYDL